MSNERQEIAEKIRDGSYFEDARNWYAIKYLYPIAERSMVFLFTIAVLFALIPIVVLLHNTVQTHDRVPFPIIVEDSTSHFSVIRPLAQKNETAQEAVAKYLIADYIKSREEYIYQDLTADKLKKLLKKIKSSSAKPILNEYVSYMNENNPYSPLIRYKDHTNRFIQIKSLSFLDNDQTSGKAKVIFNATEQVNTGETRESTWEVIINFRLPDVATIARTGAPLRFIVNYYRAKLVSTAVSAPEAKDGSVAGEVPAKDKASDAPESVTPAVSEDKAEQNTGDVEEDAGNVPETTSTPNQEEQGQ